MIAGTPVDVIAEFYPALAGHDQTGSLSPRSAGLRGAHVVGDKDMLIPEEHSERIASCCRTPSASCSRRRAHGDAGAAGVVNRGCGLLRRAYRAAATGSHRGVR